MNANFKPAPATRLLGLGLAVALVLPATAASLRTQTIPLQAGWNAVYLEVAPLESDPTAVFEGLPVDQVAHFFRPSSTVQFITDPARTDWKKGGWGVWYAPHRPDALLSDLYAIQGHKAYLVHATADAVWSLTGTVTYSRIRWRAHSFNLIGFGVDELAPPTFASFFSGSGGKVGSRIYRLEGGKWLPVDPASTLMRSGEACWVFCESRTDYQGPVDLKLPGLDELSYGISNPELSIQLKNNSVLPLNLAVERVPSGGDLPLAHVTRDLSTLRTVYTRLVGAVALPALKPGFQDDLRLQVRREEMTLAEQSALLRVTTDQGVRFWIPAKARHPNL